MDHDLAGGWGLLLFEPLEWLNVRYSHSASLYNSHHRLGGEVLQVANQWQRSLEGLKVVERGYNIWVLIEAEEA